MSTLFVKYLPVPGEIQVGDKLRYDDGSIVTVTEVQPNGYLVFCQWESHGVPCSTQFIVPREKAVRLGPLTLCSRDVQEGDEVLNPGTGDTLLTAGPIVRAMDSVWFRETPGEYRLSKCFKPIGLVSPGATWLKEGDELDEDQVKQTRYYAHIGDRTGYIDCEIKCPTCGHFH